MANPAQPDSPFQNGVSFLCQINSRIGDKKYDGELIPLTLQRPVLKRAIGSRLFTIQGDQATIQFGEAQHDHRQTNFTAGFAARQYCRLHPLHGNALACIYADACPASSRRKRPCFVLVCRAAILLLPACLTRGGAETFWEATAGPAAGPEFKI